MKNETDPSATAAVPATTVRTFLIADIRGYTRFTAERGDEAAARLADVFAAITNTMVEQRGGTVIELRGDEALAAFDSPRQALRAALDLQERFRQEEHPDLPLHVGMGIDAGEAIPVQGGYRGGALNLAARLCSIAGPGEVLASEGVVHLARKTEGIAFLDRGEVSVKGLSSPIRVIQIAPRGELPDALPPLQPIVTGHPNNLPDEPTPFIGREREIDQIAARLRDTHVRLMTLTGPGGTGKTRLALQVANTLLYDFSDGVFFRDLSSLSDPTLVPAAITETLGARAEPGQDSAETIVRHLQDKHLLLVLDNFEHLLDARSVVASLLDDCRNLHILTTSRIPLHLSREQEHAVPPLSTPDTRQVTDAATLSQYESVALFIQRAKAARDTFTVTDENAPAVAEICSRLDGLPLAIELAAARIKLFPPRALLQRLSSRLQLLTGGARDRPSRQQTMRGAIDWSYSLLSEEEQVLFARFSVFAGGCTFEAAEAVCNHAGDLDLLDALSSLVDKSLVRQEGEAEPRFSMLETIREYAAEKLTERGETDTIRAAHARHFLQLAEDAEPELTAADQHLWMDRLATEYENLRAALGWFAATPGFAEQGLRLAGALPLFWFVRGLYRDGLQWLERMLTLDDDEGTPARIGAVWGAGMLWTLVGDEERARPLLEQSLVLARRIGHDSWIARSLNVLGLLALFQNNHLRARELLEESVKMARRAGDTWCLADALGTLGSIYPLQGEFALAKMVGTEALSIARRRGDRQGMRMALFGLALAAARLGDLMAARTWGDEGLAICREIADQWFIPYFLWILAMAAIASGDLGRARAEADESVQVARRVEGPLLIVCALEASAAAARSEGNDETAQAQLAEAEFIGRSGMVPHSYLAAILRAQGELAGDRGDREQAQSRLEESLSLSRQIGDSWSVARSLVRLAGLAQQRHEPGHARAMVREAMTIQVQIEDKLGLAESLERMASIATDEHLGDRAANLRRAATAIRRKIGAAVAPPPDDADEAEAMSPEEAVAYALEGSSSPGRPA